MDKAYINNFTGTAKDEHKSPILSALVEKANAGTLTAMDKEEIFNHSSFSPAMDRGLIKLMGWAYSFKGVMKLYVVKTEHYLDEVRAFNKTQAREAFKGCGRVIYIQEVTR